MTRALLRFIAAVLFWRWKYEGMSLRPFTADGVDGVVRCDGGGKA